MRSLKQDARFAAVLEECCRRVQGGEDLERCLADYPPAYREELGRLVPVAARLGARRRDPAPEFQARLERRLLEAVDAQRRARRAGAGGGFGRLFAAVPLLRLATIALVVVLVLAGGTVGAIQAADDSLPDSPLYQVKTAREWLAVTLARDGESRAGAYARQVLARGRELERAVQTKRPRPVVDVLTLRLAASTDRAVDQALELHGRGNSRPAAQALVVVRAMQREVDRVSGEAAAEVRPTLRRLRSFLEHQERRLLERNVTVL